MRVLHVIPAIAPRYGGPSQAVIEMCQALRERAVDVMIATTDADGEGRLPVDIGTCTPYKTVPAIFFHRQLSEAFKYSHHLKQWLQHNVASFDVVHIHGVFSHSSITAAIACQSKEVPYIVRPSGSLNPWGLKRRQFAKAIIWRMGVRRMLNNAAAIHYTTVEEKRLAEQCIPISLAVVVPLGVDQGRLRAERALVTGGFAALKGSPYVLLLSRLHPIKNIESLIKAFIAVTDSPDHRQWNLVIAGEGDAKYVARLKWLASESNNVIFTGWLEGENKSAVLEGASLFVLPSYQENFGVSVVEAMILGVPVLVSKHVNLATDIAAAGAGWVADSDNESLQCTLREALGDEQERLTRGAAGKTVARSRFTWQAVTAKLCELYGQVSMCKQRVMAEIAREPGDL